MKKLILCDMDGTLLNSKLELPKRLDQVIAALKLQDIRFGIASGRQYFRLKKQFANYSDMLIVAENGASVYEGEKCLFYEALDDGLVINAENKLLKRFNYGAVYSGLKGSYIHPNIGEVAYQHTARYCENIFFYKDINEVLKNDRILKIAYYIGDGNSKKAALEFKDFNAISSVVVSGQNWVDINGLGMNKGKALKKLQDLYGLKAEDCIAFGDYDNDIELLKTAYYSYAMANADQKIKDVANFTCPSNDDDGVMKTLIELFKLKIKD